MADASGAGEAAARPTDLLLLDEPTNHLDLEARNWLEGYLSSYPHAVILVSHDRFFLDAVVTRITDLNLRSSPTIQATTRTTSPSAMPAWSACARRSASRTKRSRA
jgi:ATPase subunit of ABC transporter with duplicated ATPase domains